MGRKIGPPIITFNRQLLYDDSFPLPKIVKEILILGERTMGCPVEIEFAGNFRQNEQEKHSFNLLQIRPSIEIFQKEIEEIELGENEKILAYSSSFLVIILLKIFKILYTLSQQILMFLKL